jgi:hypothetical protein
MRNAGAMNLGWIGALLLVGMASVTHAGSYEGKHQEWVDMLLTRGGKWDCPKVAPSFKADACARDRYVGAALISAWAAECHARSGEKEQADVAAERTYELLRKVADGFCSKSRVFASGNEGSCDTDYLFDCADMFLFDAFYR